MAADVHVARGRQCGRQAEGRAERATRHERSARRWLRLRAFAGVGRGTTGHRPPRDGTGLRSRESEDVAILRFVVAVFLVLIEILPLWEELLIRQVSISDP